MGTENSAHEFHNLISQLKLSILTTIRWMVHLHRLNQVEPNQIELMEWDPNPKFRTQTKFARIKPK